MQQVGNVARTCQIVCKLFQSENIAKKIKLWVKSGYKVGKKFFIVKTGGPEGVLRRKNHHRGFIDPPVFWN